MNTIKFIKLLILLLYPIHIGFSQSHEIEKLSYEDGLMHKTSKGFFQDDNGVIWIANGNGFTRLYGDGFDQIKADRYVFQWSGLNWVKQVENDYYWQSSYVHSNQIDYTPYTNHEVNILQGSNGTLRKMMTEEFVDKYGYFWSFQYDSKTDSLIIYRHNGFDSLNVAGLLKDKGIEIKKEHEILDRNYWKRMPAVQNFIEDNKGNIWFNTENNALYKLDFGKKEIKNYGEFNNVAEVSVKGKDEYWISVYPTTSNPKPGVYQLFENGKVNHFDSESYSKLYLNENNNVILLDQNGIYEYATGRFDTVFQKQNLYALQFDSHGRIYGKHHANDSTTIFILEDGKYNSVIKLPEQSFQNEVFFYVDREDIIWISSPENTYKCVPTDMVITQNPNDDKKYAKWKVDLETSNGNKFFNRTDGLYVLQHNKLKKVLDDLLPLQSNIVEDNLGNVYVLTAFANQNSRLNYGDKLKDLYKITPNLKKVSLLEPPLKKDKGKVSYSGSKMRFYNNELFLFTKKGVYYKKENQQFKFVSIDTSKFTHAENTICKGTDFQILNCAKIIKEGVKVDRFGRAEASSYKFDFKTKKLTHFNDVNDTLNFRESQFWKIKSGWFGFAEQGIVVSKNNEVKFYPFSDSNLEGIWKRPVSWVEPLISDDGNVYYQGKGMGIINFNYNTGEFYQKRVREGLLTTDISLLFFSPDSTSVFASSSFGLQQINRSSISQDGSLKISKTWDNSTGYNGAWKYEFVNDSLLKLWGSNDLIYTIDLTGSSLTQKPPKIFFTAVDLHNASTDWRNFSSDINYTNYGRIPNNIELTHDQNHLTFFYQGVNHFDNEMWYEYKLEGLQDEWVKTNNKSISYPELSPGEYNFKVRAVNNAGSSEEIAVNFDIAKPWYQTAWARIIFLLILVGAIYSFVRMRTSALRKRQEVLEKKVEDRTAEVVEQKLEAEKQRDIVEEKNREILDSITYAKRLQTAILPPQKLVKEWLNDSFIFYKPKDIVAGDFYWMETTKRNGRNVVFFAAADCTGHGVPGAMVSVVCSNALKRAVREFNITDPGELLDKVAELVQESFEQSEHDVKDGMDIAVCAVDLMDRKVWFAGAHNSLYRITSEDTKVAEGQSVLESGNRKLIEYKANKQPVGSFENMEPFKTIEIVLEPGDCIYLFSDGFADQFGGEKGKKFKYKPFKQLLLDIESKEMDSQKDILDTEFERWKGALEQVDDVCIIGLRVNGHMRKLFSKRELEVIKKIKEGRQSKEIAEELHIAKSTVDTHRKRILAKTNLNNAAELIKFCNDHEVL